MVHELHDPVKLIFEPKPCARNFNAENAAETVTNIPVDNGDDTNAVTLKVPACSAALDATVLPD